ncbi:oxidoreductase [Haemophilus paracuniculus]|uniref:Oxidoreductase n=1 Tax=Haemophilus paracuniculus TaxID=734 RepID=A0A1T0AR10_9PAST|nr:Gfo/Idh/MocA family oxidoreductase [Haemophilus paracuniculus]OOR98086.1 oxidoreductase [Haemophilus paracuniculus]
MKTLNVALAGFGYASRVFHFPFLSNDPRFAIKKVYERTTNRASEHLPQVEIVRDFADLLTPEIDLVIITTPNQTHYAMAKQALQAGKNVLVEKPLVATQAEAVELDQLAKANGVLLSVYQNRRWDSAAATAKQIIEQNLLGEIVDCEIRFERYAKGKNAKQWKETGEVGTGLVYDLGVHLLDQAVTLFGKPSEIFADIRYQHEGALSDDAFDIHLYYPNGLKVALIATKYAREAGNHFSLHGRLGSYVKKNVDNQEGLLAAGAVPQGDWNVEPESEWGILHTEINGEVVRQSYPNAKASYQDFYDNLYQAITTQTALAVTAEQAGVVLGLIEKAFESERLGHRIVI